MSRLLLALSLTAGCAAAPPDPEEPAAEARTSAPVIEPTKPGGEQQPEAPKGKPRRLDPLAELAAEQAQGMTLDGTLQQVVGPNQALKHPMQLAPGKCYLVLAASDALQHFEITLGLDFGSVMPGFPLGSGSLAATTTTNGAAVLGGSGGCFRNPMPMAMPAVLAITASKGSGVVRAHVYVK